MNLHPRDQKPSRFKLFGIPVRIHWTFLILLGWYAAMQLLAGANSTQAFVGVVFVIAVFVCVVLHELGHSLAARRYGIQTKGITILPIGGVAQLDEMPKNWRAELVIAIAGPAVNIVIALALLPLLLLVNPADLSLGLIITSPSDFLMRLIATNIFLVAFNMIPAFPMDGGRVLRALLSASLGHWKATNIAARIGQFFAVLLALAGIFFLGNIILVFVAGFVFFAAESERRATRAQQLLDGWRVGDAMTPNVFCLDPAQPVGSAVESMIRSGLSTLPVGVGGRVMAIVRQPVLLGAIARGAQQEPIGPWVESKLESVREFEPLTDALDKLRRSECDVLPVIDESALLSGMISVSAIQRVLEVAQSPQPPAVPPPFPQLRAA
ncbi:MAG: site-2 protease family protein [Verrucomicrobiota bacterium]